MLDSSVGSSPNYAEILLVICAVGINSSSAILLRNFMTACALLGSSMAHSYMNTRNCSILTKPHRNFSEKAKMMFSTRLPPARMSIALLTFDSNAICFAIASEVYCLGTG